MPTDPPGSRRGPSRRWRLRNPTGGVLENDAARGDVVDPGLLGQHGLPHLVDGASGVVDPAVGVDVAVLRGLAVLQRAGLPAGELALAPTAPTEDLADVPGVSAHQEKQSDQQQ